MMLVLSILANYSLVSAFENSFRRTLSGCRYPACNKSVAIVPQKGKGFFQMAKDTYRIVTRGADGEIRIRDYDNQEALLKRHMQIGVDDCSTDLGLRGLPVFRGLVGPMPEGKNIIRYESPEVFETLTKDWSSTKSTRRRRSRTHAPQTVGASLNNAEEMFSVDSNKESDFLGGIR